MPIYMPYARQRRAQRKLQVREPEYVRYVEVANSGNDRLPCDPMKMIRSPIGMINLLLLHPGQSASLEQLRR